MLNIMFNIEFKCKFHLNISSISVKSSSSGSVDPTGPILNNLVPSLSSTFKTSQIAFLIAVGTYLSETFISRFASRVVSVKIPDS